MNIGLYDVDSHNFPNLPLMKISAWHKARGDSVVLNGYLYVDSYASIKGKYYTNKRAKITKIAPNSNLRKAPYLLDNGLGWVRAADITK